MKTIKLLIGEDKEYGDIGLRLKNQPGFNFLSSRVIAHDILEHFPQDNGCAEWEVMALGASLFVRENWWLSAISIIHNLASDIHFLFRNESVGDFSFGDYQLKRKRIHFDSSIFDVNLKELEKELILTERSENNDEDIDEDYLKQWCAKALPFLCEGYWKAKRRYKNYRADHLNYMFNEMQRTIDTKKQYLAEEYCGLTMNLSYSLKNHFVKISDPQE